MKNRSIVITGANGFIGRYLTEEFANRGYKVTALVHSTIKAAWPNVDYRQFDLSSFSSDIIPEGTEVLIHLAYIKPEKNNSSQINFESTRRLIRICREKKVSQVLFFSSFSATDDAISEYGRSKLACESLFDGNDLIISPGLVIGYGGLFKKIDGFINRNWLIPAIGGGKQPLQYISVKDVFKVVETCMVEDLSGRIMIANQNPITMKEFYKAIGKMRGKRLVFINVGYFVADIGFWLVNQMLKSSLVSRENYLGLKLMKVRQVNDIEKVFGFKPMNIDECLTEVKKYEDSCNHDHSHNE